MVSEVASILKISEAKILAELKLGKLCANAEVVTGGGHTICLPNMFDLVDFEAKRILESFGVRGNEADILMEEVWPEICRLIEAGDEQMINLLSEALPSQKEIVYSLWTETRGSPNEFDIVEISTAVSRISRLTLLLVTNTWKPGRRKIHIFERGGQNQMNRLKRPA